MSAFGDKKLIISKDELPIVNGCRINSIYGKMETAYEKKVMEDSYSNKPDYYLLCTDDVVGHGVEGKHWNEKKPNIKVRKLPKEIAALFGKQSINGKKTFVSRMWIRTSDSYNGSFIDSSMSLNGGSSNNSITYYRTEKKDWGGDFTIFKGSRFEKKILKVLNKEFTVEALPFWFDVEYPFSTIRTEGGLNYPDVKLETWRWLYGMPYVGQKGYGDRENIRVFNEKLNAHVYLEAIPSEELKEGMDDLIAVQFSYEHKKKSENFCHIIQWVDSKEGVKGQEMIRFKILKNTKTKFQCASMLNGEIQYRSDRGHKFYKLIRLSFVD